LSRKEELEKKPFSWRERHMKKECETSHSNLHVEAWKREVKKLFFHPNLLQLLEDQANKMTRIMTNKKGMS
jgi:hypothetical protein